MKAWQWLIIAASTTIYLWQTALLVIPILADGSDFSIYYSGARALLEGHSPYDVKAYNYPPLMALVIAPLATQSYLWARWAWFILGHGALAATALLLVRRVCVPAWIVALAFALLSVAARDCLGLGQVTPWLLLCATLAVADWQAPLVLGLGFGLKFLPGASFAVFAILRRWQSLFLATAVGAIATLGPWLLAPERGVAHRRDFSLWGGSPHIFNFAASASLLRLLDWPDKSKPWLPYHWGLANTADSAPLPASHMILSIVVSLALLLAGWWLLARVPHPSLPLLFASTTALAAFVSPLAWSHYAVFYLPLSCLLLARYWPRRRVAFVLVSICLLSVHLVPVGLVRGYETLVGWGKPGPAPVVLFLAGLLPPLSGVLLLGLALRAMQTRQPSPS